MTEPRNKKCRSHCRKCNICFSGDSAFDMHISHEGELTIHNDPAIMKYEQGKREGESRFFPQGGSCDKQPGCWMDGRRVKVIPATIYSIALTDEQIAKFATFKTALGTSQDAPSAFGVWG